MKTLSQEFLKNCAAKCLAYEEPLTNVSTKIEELVFSSIENAGFRRAGMLRFIRFGDSSVENAFSATLVQAPTEVVSSVASPNSTYESVSASLTENAGVLSKALNKQPVISVISYMTPFRDNLVDYEFSMVAILGYYLVGVNSFTAVKTVSLCTSVRSSLDLQTVLDSGQVIRRLEELSL